jgi:hypothetical protein
MSHNAICFRQAEKSPVQVLFVIPTCDLDTWAKVPTRMSSRPRGFQRAALGPHVRELESFFERDVTKTNSSPTTILVGIDPRHRLKVQVTDLKGIVINLDSITTTPIEAKVVIDFEGWDSSLYGDNVEIEVTSLFKKLEEEGFFNLEESHASEEEINVAVEDDPNDVDAPISGNDAVLDDDYTIDSDIAEDEPDEPESEKQEIAYEPFDADTPKNQDDVSIPDDLRLADLNSLRVAFEGGRFSGNIDKLKKLKEILKDERKPGLIIDGQHRVAATKSMGPIPFGVCLIPGADWAELAFQFIVNNHTAKKVDENLLTAIVGQSLNDKELSRIESRLNRAGIKVQLIRASTRIQVEDNPFMGMLRTSTVGERGFLESSAMQKHVIGLWFGKRARVTDRPGMANFQLSKKSELAMQIHKMANLFLSNCEGVSQLDKMHDWQRRAWIGYFSAFWGAVRDSYRAANVWPQTQDDWPSPSAAKQTPNQQTVQKLMRTTLLGLFQMAVLQRWADRRFEKFDLDEQTLKKTPIDVETFYAEVKQILEPLTPDFFVSLNTSGFDGSAQVKEDMKIMMYNIMKKSKSVAETKAMAQYSKYFV